MLSARSRPLLGALARRGLSAEAYDAPFMRKRPANYEPLTPLSFLERAALIYPDGDAMLHAGQRHSWAQQSERCTRLASALRRDAGIRRGDTVAVLAPNVPVQNDAFFGVAAAGGVLNSINTRLDAEAVRFILEHGEAKALLVDRELVDVAREAVAGMSRPPFLIDVAAPDLPGASEEPLCDVDYEQFLASGDPGFAWQWPQDEWDAFSLNYTSGTTGNPKGVVYHHRGAYLNGLANPQAWQMPQRAVYLWTLPAFHCNAWMMPSAVAAQCGTNVMLRGVHPPEIFQAIEEHGVTHLCGAPIVMTMLMAERGDKGPLPRRVNMMGAGAPPPAAVIQAMGEMGVDVQHVFGLTETYGPAMYNAWQPEWADLDPEARAKMQALQGVPYVALCPATVGDPDTGAPKPHDGESMGEIFCRGNLVMKGYLKNEAATEEAFKTGAFATGDLGVIHPNGYLQVKDRSKDVIISGGENISSIEVESAIHRMDGVQNVAVVAMPHEKWGETPCAFVELAQGAALTEQEVRAHCKSELAHFKAPGKVVFGDLPKTSTGKVTKFTLRDVARALAAE